MIGRSIWTNRKIKKKQNIWNIGRSWHCALWFATSSLYVFRIYRAMAAIWLHVFAHPEKLSFAVSKIYSALCSLLDRSVLAFPHVLRHVAFCQLYWAYSDLRRIGCGVDLSFRRYHAALWPDAVVVLHMGWLCAVRSPARATLFLAFPAVL